MRWNEMSNRQLAEYYEGLEKKNDEMYWELLEEQHAHDVVMVGAEGGEENERTHE